MKQIKHERDQILTPQLGGLEIKPTKEQIQGGPMTALEIVLTKDIFDFMGYEGVIDKQQEKFKALLNRSSIPFKEVEYSNTCTNEFIKAEAKSIAPQNLSRKRWRQMLLSIK
jgi:hypothetical protein